MKSEYQYDIDRMRNDVWKFKDECLSEFLKVPINSPATIVRMKTANRMMIALFGLCIR